MNEIQDQPQAPEEAAPGTPPAPPAESPQSFEAMNLDPAVKQALEEMGYSVPMEVQSAVYARVTAGKDLMVQSRTGSGKTAAFGIPIAQLCTPGQPGVQALILAPTRELALQVSQELSKICAYRNLQVVPVYGGAPMGRQIDALKAGAQIVCGTPGRVLDHIRRGTLKTGAVRMLVLDECDEMLSMGFQEEIEKILSELPRERQTLLFSATIPEEIERIGRRHMRDFEKVVLSADFVGVHEIRHAYYLVSGLGRTRDLLRVLEFEQPETAIIFCNTREDTSVVAQFLKRHGYDAEAISSDLTQSERERVMTRMRDKNLRFLVATDIAARGIDISDLSHVINFTFPESPEVYIHRTGRTGRAGKSGVAVSLIGPREIGSFYYLKLLYKIKPEERELPSEAELKTRREAERFAKLAEEVSEEPGDEWRSLARRVWQSGDGERIVAALVKRVLEGAPRMIAVRETVEAAPAPARVEREPRERADREGREPREGREGRERGGRERGREARGEGRERGERGGRERGREARGEGRERGERGGRERGGRERGERGGERERRERRPAETREAREALTPAEAPPPGGEDREFWEAWVDEKTQQYGAVAAAEGAPAAPSPEAGAPPREPATGEARPSRERTRRTREEPLEEGHVRLYVNVGKREGLSAEDISRLFTEASPDVAAALGRVALRDTHTYVSVRAEVADAAIEALRGKKVGERDLVVERAKK